MHTCRGNRCEPDRDPIKCPLNLLEDETTFKSRSAPPHLSFVPPWPVNVYVCLPAIVCLADPIHSWINYDRFVSYRRKLRTPLTRLPQWAGEVISSKDKTIVTEEFKDLEDDIELRRKGIFKCVPNHMHRSLF